MDKHPLLIVSNASVQKSSHSGFAWILAQATDPLWCGQGLAPGPVDDIHSGQAEAMGLLTALLFLSYYVKWYEPLQPTDLTCYCNNVGVITNIIAAQDVTNSCPNDTTANNCDLYFALADTIKSCSPIMLNFLHVQGHQDTKKDWPLMLAELYNVECDKHAKEYVTASQVLSTSLRNPKIEVAQPHLFIENKLICHQYLLALCEAAALLAYNNYLHKKLTWTRKDVTRIHWHTLAQAIHAFHPNSQWQIILFINNKLPLHMSKAHPHPGSKLCPSCQREEETIWHFLECQHCDRKASFTMLKNNLTKLSIQNQLHPSLLTSFWLGLVAIQTAIPYPIPLTTCPLKYASQPKNKQALAGTSSTKAMSPTSQWATGIDMLNPGLKFSGCQMLTQIIKMVWLNVFNNWKIWNQHFHNNAGQLSLPDYHQAVQTMYEQCHQLPPAAQEAIFNQPLAQILELPPAALHDWIKQSQKYMTQQLRAAKKWAKLRTADICSFFTKPTSKLWPSTTLGNPVTLNQCGSFLFTIGLER